MKKLFPGDLALYGWAAYAGLIVALLAVNVAAVWLAAERVLPLFEPRPYEPWVAPRPATASEALAPGRLVPDFTLTRVGGREAVRLADLLRDRPVVLILSSFTCDLFTAQQPFLEELAQSYRGRAEFLMVVIREARHRIPGVEFLLEEPADREHRHRLVARAIGVRHWSIPAVLDADDAQVEQALRAFPLRLVVVGRSGRIEFATRFTPGAFGLDQGQVTRWFEENLGPPDLSEEGDPK